MTLAGRLLFCIASVLLAGILGVRNFFEAAKKGLAVWHGGRDAFWHMAVMLLRLAERVSAMKLQCRLIGLHCSCVAGKASVDSCGPKYRRVGWSGLGWQPGEAGLQPDFGYASSVARECANKCCQTDLQLLTTFGQ